MKSAIKFLILSCISFTSTSQDIQLTQIMNLDEVLSETLFSELELKNYLNDSLDSFEEIFICEKTYDRRRVIRIFKVYSDSTKLIEYTMDGLDTLKNNTIFIELTDDFKKISKNILFGAFSCYSIEEEKKRHEGSFGHNFKRERIVYRDNDENTLFIQSYGNDLHKLFNDYAIFERIKFFFMHK